MNAGRTVTVPTIDQGDVTMPEPAWCAGHHDGRPEYRSDIGHRGPEHRADFCGYELSRAEFVQYPFGEHSDRSIGVHVEMGHLAHVLTPDELDELAAVLVDYAGKLRHLARQLSVLKAGDE